MKNKDLDLGDVTIKFRDDGIVNLHFRGEHTIEANAVEKVLDTLQEEYPKMKCHLLITGDKGFNMSQEARAFASSDKYDAISCADAIVQVDYSHQMAANFFIRFSKPNRPVKIFPDEERAVTWLLTQIAGNGEAEE